MASMVDKIQSLCRQFPFATAWGVWDYGALTQNRQDLGEGREAKPGREAKLSSPFLQLHGEKTQVFPWMSVTKLLASRVFLAAAEHGIWTIDATLAQVLAEKRPEGYLPQQWEQLKGLRIGDLLAHCSGVDTAAAQVLLPPRQKRIYSNFGYELLGEVLALKSGVDFSTWLQSQLLNPLELDISYETSPAWGISGTISELAIFALEAAVPKYLAPHYHQHWICPYQSGLAGILPGWGRQADNQWALGPELRGNKNPHWLSADFSPQTYGHFGQSGSFLWVDPQVKKAGFFLGAEPFGPIHRQLWPELNALMRAL